MHILEWVPLSRNEDAERFVKMIEQAIQEGEVKKTKKFTQSKGKIKLLAEEGVFKKICYNTR